MHFAYLVSSHTSTHFFEDGIRGAAATRKGAPSTRREYEVAGALCFSCTNATSGIMRRRRLMCESRVCPHPKGFADSKRGKHVRKGDIFSRGIMHYAVFLFSPKNAIFGCIVRKSPDLPADAYLVYVYSHIAYSKHKKAIFRWMTRKKKPQGS